MVQHQSSLCVSAFVLLVLLVGGDAFSTSSSSSRRQPSSLSMTTTASPSSAHENNNNKLTTRKQLLSGMLGVASSVALGQSGILPANADDTEPAVSSSSPSAAEAASYSITKCNPSNKKACVSTANVRNLDLYMTPWTYETSTDDMVARLKGAIVADPTCSVVKQEGNAYLQVEAKRLSFGTTLNDTLEFVINDSDKVVTFKSEATGEGSDFGVNKKRLEDIRKRAGVFGLMGESLNSADSVSTAERGNGPLGQLKAFYGLQSGAGFEDVVLDK